MGLPGAGKTTLANEMAPLLNAKRLNADEVRKAANDWDFSEEGRVRQAKRMAEAALKLKAEGHYVIADFIAPTPEARSLFPADFRVWVDTIESYIGKVGGKEGVKLEQQYLIGENGLELMSHHPLEDCLLYTSPSPRDRTRSRMPSSA